MKEKKDSLQLTVAGRITRARANLRSSLGTTSEDTTPTTKTAPDSDVVATAVIDGNNDKIEFVDSGLGRMDNKMASPTRFKKTKLQVIVDATFRIIKREGEDTSGGDVESKDGDSTTSLSSSSSRSGKSEFSALDGDDATTKGVVVARDVDFDDDVSADPQTSVYSWKSAAMAGVSYDDWEATGYAPFHLLEAAMDDHPVGTITAAAATTSPQRPTPPLCAFLLHPIDKSVTVNS